MDYIEAMKVAMRVVEGKPGASVQSTLYGEKGERGYEVVVKYRNDVIVRIEQHRTIQEGVVVRLSSNVELYKGAPSNFWWTAYTIHKGGC